MGGPRRARLDRGKGRRCHRGGPLRPEEERRLRRVVVGLFARGRDATVPPRPTLPREGRLRMLWSADVQLVVLVITVIVLSWLWLSPWFVRCVYGVNC